MNDSHLRYSDTLEEDKLFYASTPHLEEFQRTAASILDKYFSESSVQSPKALELGCGTGTTAQYILSKNSRVTLDALDNEQDIVAQARERLREYEKEARIKIHLADIFEYLTNQESSSLDAVVSAFTLHNCTAEYRKKTYSEIMRVLKLGGIFINADKYASDDKIEHKQALEWQLVQFDYFDKQGRADLKEKWTKHYLQDEEPGVILRESDFVRELQSIGFKNIEKIFRKHMEAIYVAQK